MKALGHRPSPAIYMRVCRVPLPCLALSDSSAVVGSRAPLADNSRLGSNSQASSSSNTRSWGSVAGKTVTKCALQPVPFESSKLTVQYLPGTAQSGQCSLQPRRYTLTHNDLTGQLLLTVGHQYNAAQLSGWYNRLLRDEILAYWQFGTEEPVLHIECHVSGEETWLAPPILRNYIFRREMPLVLNVINFAEADLFADNPAMADANVMVHLASHVKAYHATVLWGSLSDCNSWQPPPQWSRARAVVSPVSSLAPNIGNAPLPQHKSLDPNQQSLALAAADESLQDQPCVLPAADLEGALHTAQADSLTSVCQQQTQAVSSLPVSSQRNANGTASSSASAPENSQGSRRKARQNAACYRLHVACTAAVSGLPIHMSSPINSSAQQNAMLHSAASGLAYHVPPRLGRFW